jgi:hypothetical protein
LVGGSNPPGRISRVQAVSGSDAGESDGFKAAR